MRSSVNTSPLEWRSIRTVKLLNGDPPANVDRAVFIFQVPEVASRPCPKQAAESSADTSKTCMAHNAAKQTANTSNRGLVRVGNAAITLKTCARKVRVDSSGCPPQRP